MSELTGRLEAIEARHGAWYSGDDTTAEWADELSFVEGYEHDHDSTPRKRAMAHEITREDVPFLLELARKQQAAIDAVKAIHVPVMKDGEPVGCSACDWDHPVFSFRVLWPCPTVNALEAKP